ncbi:MAG: hypothetical protein Q9181_002515 [Wetmoreana brouardii]
MRRYFVLICILSIWVRLNLAVFIAFMNSPPSAPQILQRVDTYGRPDACGIPLDLDLLDGRGYGWFRADHITFTEMVATDTFTAVYGKTNQHPCSGAVIAHRMGDQEWHTEILTRGGAGSALVLTRFPPDFGHRQYPDSVFVGDEEFMFIRAGALHVFWYQSRRGAYISGRKFEDFIISKTANTTASAVSLSATSGNRTIE